MRTTKALKVRLLKFAAIAVALASICVEQAAAGRDYGFTEEPPSFTPSSWRNAAAEELFDTKAIAIPTNRFRSKWENLVKSLTGAGSPFDVCDGVKATCNEAATRWVDYLSAIRSLPKREQIGLVNGYVNRHINYTNDVQTSGARDHWASPLQAIGGRGDCEDYAIAKYFSLISLGFSDDQIRLVIVRNLNAGEMHALTTVSVDGSIYVLDNRFEGVLPDSDVLIYQPIYSFNQRQSWLHVGRSFGQRSERGDPAS